MKSVPQIILRCSILESSEPQLNLGSTYFHEEFGVPGNESNISVTRVALNNITNKVLIRMKYERLTTTCYFDMRENAVA